MPIEILIADSPITIFIVLIWWHPVMDTPHFVKIYQFNALHRLGCHVCENTAWTPPYPDRCRASDPRLLFQLQRNCLNGLFTLRPGEAGRRAASGRAAAALRGACFAEIFLSRGLVPIDLVKNWMTDPALACYTLPKALFKPRRDQAHPMVTLNFFRKGAHLS